MATHAVAKACWSTSGNNYTLRYEGPQARDRGWWVLILAISSLPARPQRDGGKWPHLGSVLPAGAGLVMANLTLECAPRFSVAV
jgi:hypothetical protein